MQREELDAYWVATSVVATASYLALSIEPVSEDANVAGESGDWPTAMEAAIGARLLLAAAETILDGSATPTDEVHLIAALAYQRQEVLVEVAAWPSTIDADEASVEEAVTTIAEGVAALRDALPIDIPFIRTPEGFFPTIRVAADLERLRTRLGLPPYPWIPSDA